MDYLFTAISLCNDGDGICINEQIWTKDEFSLDLDDGNLSDIDVIKSVRAAIGHRKDARGYTLVQCDEYGISIDHNTNGPAYYLKPKAWRS